jgi:ATP-dependent NAD(P)H-hydrate dehydratase
MPNIGNRALLKRLVSVFPALHDTKGQNGRVAVIGGSFEFTGAPYYSAISALKVGGDLGHIFCSKFSSPAIKSYSPEIITHPLFISSDELQCSDFEQEIMLAGWANKLKAWEKAIHAYVIGPGLGRDQYMNNFFPIMVKAIPDNCVVIFDADGIYYLCQYPFLFD